MPAPLILAAAGLSALGTGLQVYGNVQQGKAAKEAGERQAAIQEQTANEIERVGKEERRVHKIFATKQIGEMKASIGASGITMEGSALDYIAESSAMAERDSLNMKFNYQRQAALTRMGADFSRWQGETARDNYNLMAAAEGVSGISRTAGMLGKG